MTRETLRTKLREYAETVANGYEVIAFDLEDRILKEFDRIQKAEGWHDAKKDPPDRPGCYIALFSSTWNVFPAYYIPRYEDLSARWNDDSGCPYDEGEITRWKYLPQPPKQLKEEGGEE